MEVLLLSGLVALSIYNSNPKGYNAKTQQIMNTENGEIYRVFIPDSDIARTGSEAPTYSEAKNYANKFPAAEIRWSNGAEKTGRLSSAEMRAKSVRFQQEPYYPK